MIIKTKRFQLLFVLTPIILLLFVSSYFAIVNIKHFLIDEKIQNKYKVVKLLGNLEYSISNELLCTSNITSSAQAAQICLEDRQYTDKITKQVQEKNNLSKIYFLLFKIFGLQEETSASTILPNLKKDIIDVRYDIDISKNITIENLMHGGYYNKIINPIRKFVNSSLSKNINNKMHIKFLQELETKAGFVKDEGIMINYYLVHKKPIDEDILKLWDEYISNSSLVEAPKFDKDFSFSEAIIKSFKDEKFLQSIESIDNIRINTLSNYFDGIYLDSSVDWQKAVLEKESVFNQISDSIFTYVDFQQDIKMDDSMKSVYISIALILLSIISIIYFSKYYSKSREEDDILEHVVEQIEQLSSSSAEKISSNQNLPKSLKSKREIYEYIESILRLLHEKEAQANEANKAKSLFLANMSHEIRTPLNGVVGFTQLLKESPLNETQKEYTSIIETSSESLLNIVNDILDISKIQADKMTLEEVEFDLIDTIQSTVKLYMVKARSKNIQLDLYIDPVLPTNLIGDPTKLSQVIRNLINNAIKFTDTGGNIYVCLEQRVLNDGNVSIYFYIKDNGIGISEEQKKKIFEEFIQADVNTSRKFGGTGLGLSISTKLVSLMGGSLDVESEEGEGAKFYFDLIFNYREGEKINSLSSKNHVSILLPSSKLHLQKYKDLSKYLDYLNISHKLSSYIEIENNLYDDIENEIIIFDDEFENIPLNIKNQFKKANIKISLLISDIDNIYFSNVLSIPFTIRTIHNVFNNTEDKIVATKRTDTKLTNTVLENKVLENRKVLVAEDNEINQKLINISLTKLDCNVTLVNNGEEAIKIRKQENFDLIFMDIQMPIMGGIDATKEIIEYETLNQITHIPIVALTANALKGDKEKYMEVGMDDYLSKPIDMQKLKVLIDFYLSPDELDDNDMNSKALDEQKMATEDFEKDDTSNNDLTEDYVVVENGDNIEESITENVDLKVNDNDVVIEDYVTVENGDIIEQDIIEDVDLKVEDNDVLIEKNLENSIEEDIEASVLFKDILVLKKSKLSGKIFTAVFEKLGYSVDFISSDEIFLEKLETLKYNFIVFDLDFFENSFKLIIDMIKNQSSHPFVFKNPKYNDFSDCDVIDESLNIREIQDCFNKYI